MAWSDTMINILRILINDFDCADHTYTDTQLEKTLIVAAQYMIQELSFSTSYTITINPPDISPDPTDSDTLDSAFTNFVVLRAACLIDNWTFKTKAALEGIRARAGSPVDIEIRGHLQGYQFLLEKGVCATLEQLKDEYKFGNANNIKAVLSPFISNEFNPYYLLGHHR